MGGEAVDDGAASAPNRKSKLSASAMVSAAHFARFRLGIQPAPTVGGLLLHSWGGTFNPRHDILLPSPMADINDY